MSDVPREAIVEPDFFEVIGTQRAMRRLKPDPVPDELIRTLVWAATRAPSGGNRQGWRFLVVTDPEKRRQVAELYRQGWERMTGSGYGSSDNLGLSGEAAESNAKVMKSATYLAEHMHEVPVLIFCCALTGGGSGVNSDIAAGSSIYPAVQNLMLAARALGLGTTLTTLHRGFPEQLQTILGIPESVEAAALIPVGWPKGRFGAGFRKPPEEVMYWDQWGAKRA